MAKTEDMLDERFGGIEIEHKEDVEKKVTDIILTEEQELANIEEKNVIRDKKVARRHYKKLIKVGETAIDELAVVAESSQAPRAYEVLSKLLQNTAEIVEKSSKLFEPTGDTLGASINKGVVNNNTIMVGQLSDVTKAIENATTNKEIIVEPIKVEVIDETEHEPTLEEIFEGITDEDFELTEEELETLDVKAARQLKKELKEKKEEWKRWRKDSSSS